MKKFLFLLTLFICSASLLCSCNAYVDEQATTQTEKPPQTETNIFQPPSDERSAFYTAAVSNDDGVSLQITAHGYASESLNKNFYIKNNEYFLVDVTVTNDSMHNVHYFLPTYCNEDSVPHNHEIGFNLSCGEYHMHSSSSGFIKERAENVRVLLPGESRTWQLKLAAGKTVYENFDLPADGKAYPSGIKLYGSRLYDYGACIFKGSVFFGYSESYMQANTGIHDLTVSVPLAFEAVYISTEPST